MSITVAQLVTQVQADTTKGEKSLDDFGKKVDDSGSRWGGVLNTALGTAAGLGVVKLASAGWDLVTGQIGNILSATNDADQAQAQLQSTLKSTNDASGETMQGLGGLAAQIASYADFTKPAIEQSEKVLLTFTNIGKDTFPAATKAAADLAARMGMDLPSASLLIGKALNDPVKGMAALHREGVDLSAAQQEQVKHFMAVGDQADAQRVILGELNKEMGGAAKAAGGTLGGQMDILKNKLSDTEGEVGQKLEPVLGRLLARITPLVSTIGTDLVGAIDTVLPIVVNLANRVLDFVTFLQTHEAAMDAFKIALAAIGIVIATVLVAAFFSWAIAAGAAAIATIAATLPILAIGAAIALLIIGVKLLFDHWSQITAALGHFKDGVGKDVGDAFNGLGTIVHNIGEGIKGAIKGAINGVIGDINSFISFIDRIQVHIPSIGVGPVHTPALDWWGLGIGQIPYLADGGDVLGAGLALVGERGPELLGLPAGARVSPLSGGSQPSGGAGGASGGAPIVVNITTTLDGRVVAQNTVRHMPGVIRQATGGRAF